MNDLSAAGSDLNFEPIRSQRAFEEIATQIRSLISSGKLKPGDRLPAERDLSAQFDVSRNTLREALRSLEIAGLLELRKGSAGGAFIRPGSPDVIVNGLRDLYDLGAITPRQLTEARIWIEAMVVRVACERATDEDIVALEENIGSVAMAHKAGDEAARAAGNVRFHSLLGQATHNPILAIVMDGIMEVMHQFMTVLGPQHYSTVLPSRRRLVGFIKARDGDAAEAEMTRHLERIHRSYLSKLDQMKGAAGNK
ncbi:FadR/GntR family transcriptional regulator [Azoarcus sp. DN11]|uniref:FadR/GntR family transcriptional regulator n=1 Tax=Azoarcus sp. DN11 TaxID=356837 RepID=UPI000EB33DEA|nr:FadR/GntR family transcriptional regulator [Azoarcus sp. DN11]AYH43564.1 hypothetical protein CDA09_09235 [Azoarcus sp. DN11]